MPSGAISSFPAAAALAAADLVGVTQGGVSKKATMTQLEALIELLSSRPRGGLYASATGGVANTSGTPVKAAGTYTLSGFEQNFDEPVDGRLRYTGTNTETFEFICSFSLTSSVNNIIIKLFVAKNGTVIGASEQNRKVATGTDVGQMTTTWVTTLATNDYLEIFVDSASGSPTITTKFAQLLAARID